MISHFESFPNYSVSALRRLYGTGIPEDGSTSVTSAADGRGYVVRSTGGTVPILKFLDKNKATGADAQSGIFGFKIAQTGIASGVVFRVYESGTSDGMVEIELDENGAGTLYRIGVTIVGGTTYWTDYNYSPDGTEYRVQLDATFNSTTGSLNLLVNEAVPSGWSSVTGADTTGASATAAPEWGDVWFYGRHDISDPEAFFDLREIFFFDARAASVGKRAANAFFTANWVIETLNPSAVSSTNSGFTNIGGSDKLASVSDFVTGRESDFDSSYVAGTGTGVKQAFVHEKVSEIANQEDIYGYMVSLDIRSTEIGGTNIKVQRNMQATAEDSLEGTVLINNSDWERKEFTFESDNTPTGPIAGSNAGEYGIEIQ